MFTCSVVWTRAKERKNLNIVGNRRTKKKLYLWWDRFLGFSVVNDDFDIRRKLKMKKACLRIGNWGCEATDLNNPVEVRDTGSRIVLTLTFELFIPHHVNFSFSRSLWRFTFSPWCFDRMLMKIKTQPAKITITDEWILSQMSILYTTNRKYIITCHLFIYFE